MPDASLQRTDADARTAAGLPAPVRLYRNRSSWYQNAGFLLPLLGGVLALAIGLPLEIGEARGFGLFLIAVALLSAPFVIWGWRSTPTAIAVADDALVGLHAGRILKRLPWEEIVEIERKETLGNVRWRVLDRRGEHIALEGEIEELPALIAEVKRRTGRPEEEAD